MTSRNELRYRNKDYIKLRGRPLYTNVTVPDLLFFFSTLALALAVQFFPPITARTEGKKRKISEGIKKIYFK